MDGGAGATENLKTGRAIPDDVWGILCIFAEARGEPYEGQVAVGNVIRNRTMRRFFSDGTVCGTVTNPHQFSWMNTSDTQRTRVLRAKWDELETASKAWFESEHNRPALDSMFYHADYVHPYWSKAAGIEFVKRIGRHLFYREAGK